MMEIGDIVTKEQILGEWLQLQRIEPKEPTEKGMVKYVGEDTEFLFKKLENGKYQLYEKHARKVEIPFHT